MTDLKAIKETCGNHLDCMSCDFYYKKKHECLFTAGPSAWDIDMIKKRLAAVLEKRRLEALKDDHS